MEDLLLNKISELCKGLQVLWCIDEFDPIRYSSSRKLYVKTVDPLEKSRIKGSNKIIRARGITDIEHNQVPFSRTDKILDLILESNKQPESYMKNNLSDALSTIKKAVVELEEIIDQDTRLALQLYESSGYKTWSLSKFSKMKNDGKSSLNPIICFIAFSRVLSKQLIDFDFDPDNRKAFDNWELVVFHTYKTLNEIRNTVCHEYEVRIFYNSPILESVEGIILDFALPEKTSLPIELSYAMDTQLSSLVEYKYNPIVENINTVAKYGIAIPVGEGEEVYSYEYKKASSIAQSLLDSFRLIRPTEDIGVLFIDIVPIHDILPKIREYDYNNFDSGLAAFEPKRFDFSSDSNSKKELNNKDIDELKNTLSLVCSSNIGKNISYAIRRFNNSIDRYKPDDPERIIEFAIALESLYLNDNSKDRGELTYRLSLRSARILGKNYKQRLDIFNIVRNIYSLRSRIAHGEDIYTISKEKDLEKLQSVMQHTPDIVAKSIIELMPHNTSGEFWKKIELG